MKTIYGVVFAIVMLPMCLGAQLLKYSFDEGEGTSAFSSGLLKDPLTLKDKTGAPTTDLWGYPGSGPSGLMWDRALNLFSAEGMGATSSGPHGTLDALSSWDALEQFTITGWIRPLTQDLQRAQLVVIQNGSFALHIVGLSGGIAPEARSRLRLQIEGDGSWTEVDAISDFEPLWSSPGQWGFFAITYDGQSETNKTQFYCGGTSTPAAISIQKRQLRNERVQFPLAGASIWIGSLPSNTDPFHGYMDDIRIYDVPLELSEIEEVRQSALPGPALVDFRNFMPGVLDAPVYRADGMNRLSGRLNWAQLYAGPDAVSLRPWGDPLPFREGEMAGYWDSCCDPSVYLRALPWSPGQQIAVQVRAWEMSSEGWNEVMPPPRLKGESPVFYLTLLDTPTPLIGLESFSLRAAPIREIYRSGDQVVLQWSAGNGRAHYELETTSGLGEPVVWTKVPTQPVLVENYESEWAVTNQVTAPAAYYRIRLLDP